MTSNRKWFVEARQLHTCSVRFNRDAAAMATPFAMRIHDVVINTATFRVEECKVNIRNITYNAASAKQYPMGIPRHLRTRYVLQALELPTGSMQLGLRVAAYANGVSTVHQSCGHLKTRGSLAYSGAILRSHQDADITVRPISRQILNGWVEQIFGWVAIIRLSRGTVWAE
jgi:hypothetical protein